MKQGYNVHPACSRQQVHDSWNVDLYINDNLHVNEEHACIEARLIVHPVV